MYEANQVPLAVFLDHLSTVTESIDSIENSAKSQPLGSHDKTCLRKLSRVFQVMEKCARIRPKNYKKPGG